MTVPVTHVNYPDVAGWEWKGEPWTTDDGVEHEGIEHWLVFDKHNHTFMYSSKGADGQWTHIRCRGEFWEGAKTVKDAAKIATEFIEPSPVSP